MEETKHWGVERAVLVFPPPYDIPVKTNVFVFVFSPKPPAYNDPTVGPDWNAGKEAADTTPSFVLPVLVLMTSTATTTTNTVAMDVDQLDDRPYAAVREGIMIDNVTMIM
jgi:hypothetical protein